MTELVEVSLLQFPLTIWQAASAHQEAIKREFDIIRAAAPMDAVPNRLHDFIETVSARFSGLGDQMWDEARIAVERGDESIDLQITVPRVIAEVARQLAAILEEADDYCRSGVELLTLATPDEQVAFRNWLLSEFERQIGGAMPTPWDAYEQQSPVAAVEKVARQDTPGLGARIVTFDGELDLSTAGELLQRIQDERAGGVSSLTLDLTGVTFIDSVGLSLLVTAFNRTADEGGRLILRVPSRLRTLFELTGLVEVLEPDFVG